MMHPRQMKLRHATLLIIFAVALLGCLPASALKPEETDSTVISRPVTGYYSLETGHRNVLATYLSPLRYHGGGYGVSGQLSKAMPFNPRHAIMHFDSSLEFDNLLNPAETARMIGLMASFGWGMSWRTQLPNSIQLTAGASAGIEGGAYYLLRNGNNPVQAMASFNLAPRLSLSRPVRMGKLDILLSDCVSLPSLSVFFCPGYGETYYEIYLGNHSGLVHAGWWGNNFRINNLLSATIDFGKTAAMIGYRFRTDTQWANNLNTKVFSHSLVIGVVPGGIGLKKKPKKIPTETVYSIY